MDIGKTASDHAGGIADVPDGALMAFKSHIEGRNATVTVWPDRIDWHRKPLLGLGRVDTNTVMMRSVTGVRTHKGGLTYTNVEIAAGVSSVTMKVTKAQAAQLRSVITQAQAT